jgi:citrate synthase
MGKLTNIGHATTDEIFIRGLNLADDIIGKLDFVDIVYLLIAGRKPEANEKRMINALLVTGTDHGFTPSSISARLTYLGSPESLQGAVAAGLLGAGDRFLGAMQKTTELLVEHIDELDDQSTDEEFLARADSVIATCKSAGRPITGVGHPIHINGDPRTPRLRQLSEECGYYGKHWRLMDAISERLLAAGKNLPLNAVGCVGAIIADMGLDPLIGRGLAIIGRSAGLLGHIYEETTRPAGQKLWDAVLLADE